MGNCSYSIPNGFTRDQKNLPERFDVERREEDLLVGEHGLVPRGHLGREDDAEAALVDLHRPHVGTRQRVALQHGDLGQVLQQLPLA